MTYGALAVLQPLIDRRYGLYLPIGAPDLRDLAALAAILLGGVVAGFSFLIELAFLEGRSRLDGYDVTSLIRYD